MESGTNPRWSLPLQDLFKLSMVKIFIRLFWKKRHHLLRAFLLITLLSMETKGQDILY